MIYTILSRDEQGNVDSIFSFDCITSFDESWSANVTTQTVERGFNVSDHINIEPPTYDISAIISSYNLFDVNREIIWDGVNFITSGESKTEGHIEARDRLIQLFASGRVVSLLESSMNSSLRAIEEREEELKTGYYKEFHNCVITSLSISSPEAATGAFYVNLKLQNIFVAEAAYTRLEEEDITPALTPYKKEVESVSSSSSSSKGGSGKSKDDLGGGSPDYIPNDSDFKPPNEVNVGRTEAQFQTHRAKALTPHLNEKEAVLDAISKIQSTGKQWGVSNKGGVWWTVPLY